MTAAVVGLCLTAVCAPAGEFKPHVELLPYDIVGVALYPDGETPAVNLPIRVWDIERKKFIYRARTDHEGVFRVAQLDPGKCHLFVGRVKINLMMLARKQVALLQHHDIIVVLPRGLLIPSRTRLYEVLLAPALIQPPEPTKVISP